MPKRLDGTDFPTIAQALLEVWTEASDDIARMELLLRRLPPSPGMNHGVGLRIRRGQLVLVAQRLLTDLTPYEAAVRKLAT